MGDIKYAIRTLTRTPGFSVFAILTLALGIGANSAIFSVINGVLLKQLHYKDPNRLVWIWSTRKDVSRAFFSIPNFIDTREQNQTLTQLIAFGTWGANFAGTDETERWQGIRISADAFSTLGIQAELGRTLQPDDDMASAARVVMLSHGLWQRRFGGDGNVIGRSLSLNGDLYSVVGVLPPDFVIPNAEVEVLTPLRMASDPRRAERGSNFLRIIARTKSGVTNEQVRQDLAAISDRLRQQYPEDNGNLTAPRVIPLHDEIVGAYREGLIVVLSAVAVVLLIACANLANLQLARATARQREIAIRAALGATRWDLVRQLLVEGMLLAFVGGTLGLLIAIWGKDVLVAIAPADFPRVSGVVVDTPVLLFSVGTSIVAGVGVGLAPALQTIRPDLTFDLKQGDRSASSTHNHLRSSLIVAEVALSLILLICAGLLIKSFARLRSVDPGFNPARLLAIRVSLPPVKYASATSVKEFYDLLSSRLAAIPGIESVAAASALPMSGMNARTEFVFSGRAPNNPAETPAAQHRWISSGYFETMKIPLTRGRTFVEHDNEQGAGVVIVDRALARRFLGDEEPIGKHIIVTMGDGMPLREYEIVGLVENVKHVGLNEPAVPTFYGPIPQAPSSAVPFMASNFSVVVKTAIDPTTIASATRAELRKIDPSVAISTIKPMDQFLAASVAARRFNLVLLGAFAGAALILAASGLYAVIAYYVTQRTREIGVRIALGATRRHVFSLVLGHGFRLVGLGILIGLVGALAASRLISMLLYGTSSTDPLTYAIVALVLGFAAMLASYLPALRAVKVDPVVALRYE